MANNGLNVSISADVTSLQAKSAIAKTELTELNARVKSLASQFVEASDEMKASLAPQLDAAAQQSAALRSEIAELGAQMRATSAAVESSGEKVAETNSLFGLMHENVRLTGESLETLHARLNVWSGALGKFSELVMAGMGVDWIKDQVGEVAELGESYAQLHERTGATMQDMAALKLAAMETSTDFEQVGNGLRELGVNMQEALINPSSNAAQAFRVLGVSVTNSEGEMRPIMDVFSQISAKLAEMEDGSSKTALAGDVLGQRYGSQLIPVLNKTGEGFDELKQRAQDFGLVMSENDVEASERFKEAQADLSAQMVGLRTELVGNLIPALADIEEEFTVGTSTSGQLSGSTVVLRTMMGALDATLNGVVGTMELIVETGKSVVDTFFLVGQQIGDVIDMSRAMTLTVEGKFGEAKALLSADAHDMAQDYQHAVADITKNISNFEKVIKDMQGAGGGTLPAPDVPKVSAPHLADVTGWMKQEETALDQSNAAIAKNAANTKQANEEKLQNTVQFWQGVLATGNLNSQQELQAQDALAKAEMALRSNQLGGEASAARSAAEEQTQIAEAAAEARRQIASSDYQAQVAKWDAEVSLGRMSKAQEIQDEISAQERIYQAQLAEMEQEAQLSSLSVTQKAKALDEIETFTAQHNAEMARMQASLVAQQVADADKLAQEQEQAAEKTAQAWQKAFQPISQAFDSSINGVLQGTETLQQAEMKAAQSITLAFIDAAAKQAVAFAASEAEMLAHAVAKEAGITAAVAAGGAAQVAAKETTTATGKAIEASAGSATIAGDAAQAAAGAYKAVVGIPYVGPVLAPAAAAAAFSAVMAFDVLSAEGGMTIPSGVNPLVQLHEQEMVLPAHIAQPLQSMISGDTFNAGGDTSVTNHFNFTNQSSGRALDDSDAMLSLLNDAVRSGKLQKYPAIARMMRR